MDSLFAERLKQLREIKQSKLFEINSDTITDAQFSPKQGRSIAEATKPASCTPKATASNSKKALEDLSQKA